MGLRLRELWVDGGGGTANTISCPIPTLASNRFRLGDNELQNREARVSVDSSVLLELGHYGPLPWHCSSTAR